MTDTDHMPREQGTTTTGQDVRTPRPAVVARVAPFAAFVVLLALEPMLGPAGRAVGLDPRWWYAIRSVVTAALLAWYWRSYDELRPPCRASAGIWALAVTTGVAAFVAWVGLDVWPLSFDGGPGYDPRTAGGEVRWTLALIRLAGATLVVPVMEELFWRSFVMRWTQARNFDRLDPRQVGPSALALSSAVFALEHHQWFAGLLAGLAYGWLYRRTGNLWVAVVAHAVTNGLLGAWVLWTGAWGFW